jgi:hypothetical protein
MVGKIQSWVIGSFLVQLQLQLQLLLKIFSQLQLQLQLLNFFLNVIAITITSQLQFNYILRRIQLRYNILAFKRFKLDNIKNQVKFFIFINLIIVLFRLLQINRFFLCR